MDTARESGRKRSRGAKMRIRPGYAPGSTCRTPPGRVRIVARLATTPTMEAVIDMTKAAIKRYRASRRFRAWAGPNSLRPPYR